MLAFTIDCRTGPKVREGKTVTTSRHVRFDIQKFDSQLLPWKDNTDFGKDNTDFGKDNTSYMTKSNTIKQQSIITKAQSRYNRLLECS